MKAILNVRMYLNSADWLPESSEEFNDNIKYLLDSLYTFMFLPEIGVLYSSSELNTLFSNIKDIEDLFDYSITNPIQRIRQILYEIESTDWQLQKKQRDDFHYYYLHNMGTQPEYINNTSIAEACEYAHENEKVFLLNFQVSEFNQNNFLHVLRQNTNPPQLINGYNLECISISQNCIQWYHNNRIKRIYTWNKKHGENGVGIIANKGEVVSPLLCSKVEAQSFLETAIGYRKSNELYSFDSTNKKFMVWKCDAPASSSYHAYHPINQDEIDFKVKHFINNSME